MASKINMTIPELPYEMEEAVNRLRVNVSFSGSEVKRILVASSMPNEGKSLVSVYLWKALADAGMKTILVDTDLRKSEMKQKYSFQCDKEMKGLAYYLSGQATQEEVIYETNVENGFMIPCVRNIQNPASMLLDDRLEELMEYLGEEYDYVIMDAAPLGAVSDAMRLGSLCDGALLVIRSGQISRGMVKRSVEDISRSGCKLLGTVLNGVENAGGRYGKYGKYGRYGRYGKYGRYGYYSTYGYYHDESAEKAPK